jgi:hypothetical protein
MRALIATVLLSGCFGVPQDAVVERISVKAWGGSLGSCQEMQVYLLEETTARGGCDAVDPATATAVDPATIDAIQAGIERSQFAAANVNPPPDCGSCPTRAYTLLLSSESEGGSTQGRITPDPSLIEALAPLSPP